MHSGRMILRSGYRKQKTENISAGIHGGGSAGEFHFRMVATSGIAPEPTELIDFAPVESGRRDRVVAGSFVALPRGVARS